LGDASEAGEIKAQLERHGSPIGPYDILIAAQARRRGMALVTNNRPASWRCARINQRDGFGASGVDKRNVQRRER